MMSKILDAIKRAIIIKNKKELIAIPIVMISTHIIAFVYTVLYCKGFASWEWMRYCDGLFVFNFFVFIYAYFYKNTKIRKIRRKTKNYVNPLSEEEKATYHEISYICNYSVIVNLIINLVVFLIIR